MEMHVARAQSRTRTHAQLNYLSSSWSHTLTYTSINFEVHSSLVGSGQGRSGWYFKAAFLYAFFTSACVASFFNSSTVYGFLCFAPPCTAPLDRNATSSIQSNHINGYVLGRFSSAVPLAPKLQAPISTQSHLERIAVLRSHNVVLLLTALPKTDKKRNKISKAYCTL